MKNSITRTILSELAEAANEIWYIFDRPYSLFHRILEIEPEYPKYRFTYTIKRLENQNDITFEEKDGKTQIKITKNGKKKILKYKLEEFKIDKPKSWDKKWRILIFDIPEKRKLAREVLREKIKELGLYRLQDSVWIHPYDISDIIEVYRKIYEVQPYVKLILAKSVTDDSEIKEHFNL